MGRRVRRFFANYKRRGEWVELLFMTVASGLGFNVAKPWGETPRYDVIVELDARFLRVQVKSTEMWLGTCYLCQLHAAGQRSYTAKEIDYYAIYVLPADVWYIFPVRQLAGMRAVALTPHLKGHKYERYKENWWLLAHHNHPPGTKISPPTDGKPPNSMSRLARQIMKRIRGSNQ
jgi:hypothetical protein